MAKMMSTPKGWRYDRLKDVAAINRRALGAATDPNYELDYLEISNVNSLGIVDRSAIEHLRFADAPSRARRRLSEGATIISSVRPNLQAVAFIGHDDAELICSTGFNVVEPVEHKLASRYMYYYLLSDDAMQYFVATAKGVGYPAIDDKEFSTVEIPLPSRAEQEKIAAFLDAKCADIDKAIEAKKKQLELLENQWKNEITRQVIFGGADKRQKTDIVWMPEIKSGWKVISLKRLLKTRMEYGLSEAAELEDRDLPRYIRITDFDEDGTLKDETFRSLPIEVAKGAMLEVDDVLFARSGATVGKSFIYQGWETGACFAGYLIRAQTKPWLLNPHYLYYFTKSLAYDAWKGLIFTQATIQNISAVKYGSLKMPVPPIDEQSAIVERLNTRRKLMDNLFANLRKQIEVLTEYRKSLIHEYVTGVRRVA